MALDAQRGTVERSYKQDGSVLTEIDRRVEDYLFGEISRLYPDANVVTEETARSFDPDRPYTFAVDPIDGTDVFSQGSCSRPGWICSSWPTWGKGQPSTNARSPHLRQSARSRPRQT